VKKVKKCVYHVCTVARTLALWITFGSISCG